MHAVTSRLFHWGEIIQSLRRAYRRALAHRLAEARYEERRMRDSQTRD